MRHYATFGSSSFEHNLVTNTPVSYGYNASLLLAVSSILFFCAS